MRDSRKIDIHFCLPFVVEGWDNKAYQLFQDVEPVYATVVRVQPIPWQGLVDIGECQVPKNILKFSVKQNKISSLRRWLLYQ